MQPLVILLILLAWLLAACTCFNAFAYRRGGSGPCVDGDCDGVEGDGDGCADDTMGLCCSSRSHSVMTDGMTRASGTASAGLRPAANRCLALVRRKRRAAAASRATSAIDASAGTSCHAPRASHMSRRRSHSLFMLETSGTAAWLEASRTRTAAACVGALRRKTAARSVHSIIPPTDKFYMYFISFSTSSYCVACRT